MAVSDDEKLLLLRGIIFFDFDETGQQKRLLMSFFISLLKKEYAKGLVAEFNPRRIILYSLSLHALTTPEILIKLHLIKLP